MGSGEVVHSPFSLSTISYAYWSIAYPTTIVETIAPTMTGVPVSPDVSYKNRSGVNAVGEVLSPREYSPVALDSSG